MVSMALVVFCGALLVGWVGAQAPAPEAKGCCTAPQWESFVGEMSSVSTQRRSMTIAEGMKISYDATGKRVAVAGEMVSKFGMHKFKVIKNYAKEEMYVITKKGCKTIKTKSQFRKSCIPANSTSRGAVTMGSPKNQVRENVFEVRRGHMGASIAVTADSYCMPVSEFFGGEVIKRGHKKGKHGHGRMIKIHISGAVSVFNTTMGIKNPSVFTPPASCKQDDDLEDMELNGFSPEAIYMLYRHEELIENPEEKPVWVKLPNYMAGPGYNNKMKSRKDLIKKKLSAAGRRRMKGHKMENGV